MLHNTSNRQAPQHAQKSDQAQPKGSETSFGCSIHAYHNKHSAGGLPEAKRVYSPAAMAGTIDLMIPFAVILSPLGAGSAKRSLPAGRQVEESHVFKSARSFDFSPRVARTFAQDDI
jgi:hypothetical protein